MENKDITPSESEWMVMEVFWASNTPLTSSGILGHTRDEKDARIYHYVALKSKEECLRHKSKKFVNSYFCGNQTSALASLIQSIALTDEQINELEEILEKSREKGRK